MMTHLAATAWAGLVGKQTPELKFSSADGGKEGRMLKSGQKDGGSEMSERRKSPNECEEFLSLPESHAVGFKDIIGLEVQNRKREQQQQQSDQLGIHKLLQICLLPLLW